MTNEPINPERRQFLLDTLVAAASIPAFYFPLTAQADGVSPVASNNVRFLQRSDSDYLKHRQIFNKRITAMPKYIAVCANEKGVQEAVHFARTAKLPVAVKSGGHSFEGFSTNDGGLMIDLSGMNVPKYNSSSKTLLIQPGSKLGGVYSYLNQFGRLIPAGSCAGVGVAGLTLGGGYGFFARQLGLTCDSLLRVRMVDGKGQIHDSQNNPDLLWACKGGGNGNFGIITELEFKTHPAPTHFNSYRYKYRNLTPETATKLAERWFELMKTLPNTAYSSWVLNGKHLTVLLTDTASTPGTTLKAIDTKLKTGATEVMTPRKDTFLTGIQRYRGTTDPIYFKNVSAGYYNSFTDLKTMLPSICKKIASAKMTTILQINTMGGAINNPALESTAAYPHRKFAFMGELQTYYDKASQTKDAEQIVRDIQGQLTAGGITAHYRNYPDVEIKGWETAYYGTNYPRLQEMKRKFDPDNVIRHPQSVRL
ncbi:MAG TPA: FAD-binding oxidoreductase [Candidatus Thiothrix moscowensis]|uniref:FAD-binding oxidoreductase n=1 Tax=unclassified Thiothrix TaxID=2636184 RepID=UPI001A19880B|nr:MULTISPECIES: FAD-binding oxidoreductase [unclassified Thiothrix]MBJ6610439.1 FAD-binding oxidoreductase [Candidatus Thiothrix moscowensis]HRJ52471.1 FAD-binding oxidoreductase [Candidatus Thiothrix moscowensis]HRJ93343.1 FAD-binding oxidoreductase [Candidatus Thiothrix moscowensis]